jgi:hypothetical protein
MEKNNFYTAQSERNKAPSHYRRAYMLQVSYVIIQWDDRICDCEPPDRRKLQESG